ncbi:MAG: hypothetical protein WD077_09145 [Bacteroidia bacterium]
MMSNIKEDRNVEVSRLQKGVREYLGLGSDEVIFDFQQKGELTRLDLVTVNPRHNQSFLFHTEEGVDKKDALEKMMHYIKTYRDKENSYTIQWMARGSNELHTSYFRAKNIYDALDKLNYGRDMTSITVFSVVLNPVS